MTVQPVSIAAVLLQTLVRNGTLYGVIATTTPTGSRESTLAARECVPCALGTTSTGNGVTVGRKEISAVYRANWSGSANCMYCASRGNDPDSSMMSGTISAARRSM